MPHFIIEHSASFAERVDMDALIGHVYEVALETGVFPLKGIRVRAARRDQYKIADGHPDNSFVHLMARIGMGRSLEVRKKAGDMIFESVCEFLKPVYDKNPMAISFEIIEIYSETSYKTNNFPEWIEKRKE